MAQTGDKRLKVPDFIGFPRVATFQKKRLLPTEPWGMDYSRKLMGCSALPVVALA
jgi:hypothetical protein